MGFFPVACLMLSICHTFLFFCMLSNFELYHRYCVCYVLEFLDSAILLRKGVTLASN